MFNLRPIFLFLFPAGLVALSVQATEIDWRVWQDKFNRMQMEKGAAPQDSTLRIKDIEVTAYLKDYPEVSVSGYRNKYRERCITCHDGIEEISASHPREFGCIVCHGGDADSIDKDEAHATLIYDPQAGTGKRNPSSLLVADKSCGQLYCHAGHAEPDRNHMQRVKKSMMATLAGVISGLRYQWAAQGTPIAKYGVASIKDEDGQIPEEWGALSQLEALPFFSPKGIEPHLLGNIQAARVSRHVGDQLLRKQCFTCHLDSPGLPGEYRSQGCAACHFSYSQKGLYEGDDPTVSRTETGHPQFHKMTALPSNSLCTQCHKATAAISPPSIEKNSATDKILFPGQGQAKQDVHFEKGFDCIDCHTQFDIMGDGNLYSKQNQAVEIRCETCHGDSDALPASSDVIDPKDRVIRLSRHYNGWTNSVQDRMILSARKRKLTNVKMQNQTIITLGKKSGRTYPTPTIQGKKMAHVIPAHKEKLECTACHSQWVPECQGCHSLLVNNQGGRSLSTDAKHSSRVPPTALEVTTPALMVGPRGKVVPMLEQPQRTLTLLDEQKNPVAALTKNGRVQASYREWEFTNPHGYSGTNLAYALAPHSVGKKVRSCASCHLSPETLGLGEGDLSLGDRKSGKEMKNDPVVRSDSVKHKSDFPPKAKVSARGEPLAGTSQTGARPFNQEEIMRILRVGNCIPCHDRYRDRIYRDIKKSYRFAKTNKHRKLKNKILNNK